MIKSFTAFFVFIVTLNVLLWFRYSSKRKVILLGYSGILIFVVLLFFYTEPYLWGRLYTFMHPHFGGGVFVRNRELLEKAGWFGRPSSNESIMQSFTDFAFTSITFHYGWIAGSVLVLIGILIMMRMVLKIKSIKDPFGQIIIVGGVTLFGTQFLFNIGMMLGFLPINEMFLPFISYGLNPTLQTSILMGLFLSVYRRKDLVGTRRYTS